MNKPLLIAIGIAGILALLIIYFLTYDEPIQYGEGNLDPTAEDVIMFDEEQPTRIENLAKDVKELRFDIEALVDKLEKEYADEVDNAVE